MSGNIGAEKLHYKGITGFRNNGRFTHSGEATVMENSLNVWLAIIPYRFFYCQPVHAENKLLRNCVLSLASAVLYNL